jgi:phospholipase/carboxylesterase
VAGHPPHTPLRLTRRAFVVTASCVAAIDTAVCRGGPRPETMVARDLSRRKQHPLPADGRLGARSRAPTVRVGPGLYALGLARRRDALLYVPAGHGTNGPAPLAVMLHGAGGTAEHGLSLARDRADAAGLVVLAPAAREDTWDVLLGGYGPDVAFVDAALDATFGRCAVDPRRVAIGGFSDGASYALSLGLTNGDLFTHVIAFSPGFVAPGARVGAPRCYVSHGTRDAVLPIDRCSRRLVPALRRAGYAVRYHEFDGPHVVPPGVADEAVAWFTAAPA